MLKGHKKLTSPFRTAMKPANPTKPWVPKPQIVTEDTPSSRETELEAENKELKERIEWLESVLPENDWRGTEFRKNMQTLVAHRDALASENEQLKAQLAIYEKRIVP